MEQGVKRNKKDAKDLALYIANLTDAALRPLTSVGARPFSPAMEAAVTDFHEALRDVEAEMSRLATQTHWKRIVRYIDDTAAVAAFKETIENARRIIKTEIGIATLALVEDTQAMVVDTNVIARATHIGVVSLGTRFEDNDTQRLLDQLGTGGGSVVNASGVDERICTPGTREAILRRIERWIEEPMYDEKHILWLKALAGSGKTAVAGSVEKMAKAARCLGARFYFARGQPERNRRCILEISRQLASLSDRRLRDSIVAAIQRDPDIITSPAVLQYQKLIFELLLTLVNSDLKLVIVIDAVDEYEEEYATRLLELIGRDHHRLPTGIKFFLTSRVEPRIQGELEEPSVFSTVEQLLLDEEGSLAVHQDITLYLKGRLPPLVRKFGIMDKDWPGELTLIELARMAGKSFIWAATAALFVADPGYRDPVAQLEHILSTPSLENLDYLYSSALEHAFPSNINPPLLSLVREVLGTLIAAHVPLTVATLVSLLPSGTDPSETTTTRIRNRFLHYLRSVLTVPDESSDSMPVQFLHKSFVDFITTKGRCDDRFLLNVPDQHEKMAISCFRQMDGLKRNTCQLTDPSKLNSEVDDMAERIHRHIPHGLQYACEYWINHLLEITVERIVRTEIESTLEVFVRRMLLFWMEVIGLLGKTKEAILLIRLAESWVTRRGSHVGLDPLLLPLVYDAKRFLMKFLDIVSTNSLHIYISALVFTPINSKLFLIYRDLLGAGPRAVRGRDAKWSDCPPWFLLIVELGQRSCLRSFAGALLVEVMG
ncbi:hypothetical protein FRB94_008446 [Tulasnella sp. JGI-2019a]|nr:hypothetical protein FRB94_008446 [Tulasnella sp. JGI-2019a]